MENCKIKSKKIEQAWLVQLATRTKRKVTHKLPKATVNLNGYQTEMNLNTFPLGSYDVLVGMDWLEKHKAIGNFLDKTIQCIDGERIPVIVKGKLRPISIRKISALQLKRTTTKAFQVYDVQVEELGQQTGKEAIENLQVIKEFKDVFLEEIPIYPLK